MGRVASWGNRIDHGLLFINLAGKSTAGCGRGGSGRTLTHPAAFMSQSLTRAIRVPAA